MLALMVMGTITACALLGSMMAVWPCTTNEPPASKGVDEDEETGAPVAEEECDTGTGSKELACTGCEPSFGP